MTASDASGSGTDYFTLSTATATTSPPPTTGAHPLRHPLAWMMARRRNVLSVYAFGALLMVISALLIHLPEHTYIQTPHEVLGLEGAPDGAFFGIEQPLQAALPAGKHLAAEYEDVTGLPGAYFYASLSVRSKATIPSTSQALQAVMQRELPGGAFRSTSPGNLGGQMDCATATIFSRPATECVFVDTHVAGVVVVLAEKSSHSNAVKIRQAVEQRTTTDPPGTKTSRTGRLVGGALMTILSLLAAIFGPRFMQFINDHQELQLIPMRPAANLAPAKAIVRVVSIVLFIAGLAFFFNAL
jgi:hypothetical protein